MFVKAVNFAPIVGVRTCWRGRDGVADDGDIDHHLARRWKKKIGGAGFTATHGTAPRPWGMVRRGCAGGSEHRVPVGLSQHRNAVAPESWRVLALFSQARLES